MTDFRDARPLPSTLNKEILSQKDLTSQEDLLKRTENLNELTKRKNLRRNTMVENSGIEPLTSCVQSRRSPS
ncbi:hypothetical protein HMPREF1425_01231 [Helicobacter pylori GAM71Ai]|nr:hypothetical protein HMPREF1405_00783 [Helicobacter pylori GAM231Ai]EMH34465.1 hypothetical protein HMPREF1425_01231 [Helicobacter pylori GAM71Ai]EMH41370.1 hypothetical protein HMPREF1431_01621 [Helicobacter pylori GAMchJs106B]EMJ44032.1 hypothetical protein HMPREF1434_00689 [Helicobacter pylori GAMchJs124i]